MVDKPTYEELEQNNHKTLTTWQMYSITVIVGLITIGMISYGFYIGSLMTKKYTPLIDATMEIKLEATTARLLFEEIIHGDRNEKIDTAFQHLNKAEWYARVMLQGGKNSEGNFIPLNDPEMRQKIKIVQGELSEFRDISEQIFAAKQPLRIDTSIGQQYDAIFNDFITVADDVETELQQTIAEDLVNFRFTYIILIVIFSLLFVASGVFIWHRDRKRVMNLLSLYESNKNLKKEMNNRKRAEEALIDSEGKYRLIMKSMKDTVYITSKEFRIEYLNPRMIKRIGHDATGEYCYKAIYDRDEKCSWCVFDRVKAEKYVDYEVKNPRNNRIYTVTQTALHHADGDISK